MKRKVIALTAILFCVSALPLTVLADRQNYAPPAQRGVIWVVVRYKGYSSRDIRKSTKVEIQWGNYHNSGRFPSLGSATPTVGVVIRLRHDNKDSVQMTVDTDGTIVYLKQSASSPSQWNDSSWVHEDW